MLLLLRTAIAATKGHRKRITARAKITHHLMATHSAKIGATGARDMTRKRHGVMEARVTLAGSTTSDLAAKVRHRMTTLHVRIALTGRPANMTIAIVRTMNRRTIIATNKVDASTVIVTQTAVTALPETKIGTILPTMPHRRGSSGELRPSF